MIRLTHENGETIYINPDKIVDIFSTETGHAQLIFVIGEGYRVIESPEEVARKVLWWKLEMERYKAAAIVALTHRANENNPYMPPLDAQRELEILAGLEENKNE